MAQFSSLFPFFKRYPIHLMVLASGLAALSWEVVWQVKASLALGVSAWGAAITLAVTMGGMCIGALAMGQALKDRKAVKPVRIYGMLEIVVGICGLFLGPAFRMAENLDSWVYSIAPQAAPAVFLAGIIAAFGLPTLCLGATLPVIGLAARQYRTSIASLYGLNTLGAAVGALTAAFILIPWLGVTGAIWVIASINISVGVVAFMIGGSTVEPAPQPMPQKTQQPQIGLGAAFLIVFVTGFTTFVLEVAWFRSLTAAFMSTTDAFAIMLSSVLVALGAGAWFTPLLKRSGWNLGKLICWAGILILAITPLVERMDMFIYTRAEQSWILFAHWFAMTLYIVGAPVLLLGVALPWILDDQNLPRRWGMLYGFNAFSAIAGAICAGWVFLPLIGFARTAWLAGGIVVLAGLFIAPREKRAVLGGLAALALVLAVVFESGVGVKRVQGALHYSHPDKVPDKILRAFEGPEATVTAVEYRDGSRMLYIDGFVATAQGGVAEGPAHYMAWMGHMPMLLHPDPENALVICFGTGQTANAVRKEGPQTLEIVDINPRVFRLADLFTANEGVLEDSRVHPIVMDGRAYMRRTDKRYDVITLEPMPPTFAGVNALYSKEFYEFARSKMSGDGIIAQWLPFHLVPVDYGRSIAKTFQSVFPNAILWIDPPSQTGILLGAADDSRDLESNMPGFNRPGIVRDMSREEVRESILLAGESLALYGEPGEIVTDDNQLLSYGRAAHMLREGRDFNGDNFKALEQITGKR